GGRPCASAQGRASRRAARAGSQEQGEGPPGLVTLGALLTRAALRRPDAEAVVDGQRRLTYGELDARAAAAAWGFGRLGVARGDRVLLALRNRLEHVVAYWALQKLGGVAVPVNFRLAANELRYLLDDSGARVALFEDSTSGPMLEAASGTTTRLVFVGDRPAAGATSFDGVLGDGGAAAPVPEPPTENDLSLILSVGRRPRRRHDHQRRREHPSGRDRGRAGATRRREGRGGHRRARREVGRARRRLRRAGLRLDGGRARPALPGERRPRELQAASPFRVRR